MAEGGQGRRSPTVVRALARAITAAALIVAAIIVIGLLFVVLKANPHNTIVSGIGDAARALVGPFRHLFTLHDHRAEVAVNYGIAAAVYFVAGQLVAAGVRGAGQRLPARPRSTAPQPEPAADKNEQ